MKRVVLFLLTNLAGHVGPRAGHQPARRQQIPHRQRPQSGHAAGLCRVIGSAAPSSLVDVQAHGQVGAPAPGSSTNRAELRPNCGWSTPSPARPAGRLPMPGGGGLRRRTRTPSPPARAEQLSGRRVHRPVAGMSRDEVEAVLAHEVAHIANGDMVTLTLIQGVVNTFVVFLSRPSAIWSIPSCAAARRTAAPASATW